MNKLSEKDKTEIKSITNKHYIRTQITELNELLDWGNLHISNSYNEPNLCEDYMQCTLKDVINEFIKVLEDRYVELIKEEREAKKEV